MRLVVQAVGTDEIREQQRAMQALIQEMKALEDEYRKGNIDQATHRQLTEAGTEALNEHARAILRLRVEQEGLDPRVVQAAGSTRDLGRAVLEASRGFEDLQYGVRGVLNNIPPLIQAMGGGAGLAGVVSILAVGAELLYRNWDKVTDAFGAGMPNLEHVADALKELQARVKELRENPSSISDWINLEDAERRLDALTRNLSAFKALAGGQTEAEAKAGGIMGRAVKEEAGGAENLARVVKRQMMQAEGQAGAFDSTQGRIDDLKRRISANQAAIDSGGDVGGALSEANLGLEAQLEAEERQMAAFNQRFGQGAEELVGGAARGEAAQIGRLRGLFDANRGAFGAAGVGDDFGASLVAAGDVGDPAAEAAFERRQREEARAANKARQGRIREAQHKADQDSARNLAANRELDEDPAIPGTPAHAKDVERRMRNADRRFEEQLHGQEGLEREAEDQRKQAERAAKQAAAAAKRAPGEAERAEHQAHAQQALGLMQREGAGQYFDPRQMQLVAQRAADLNENRGIPLAQATLMSMEALAQQLARMDARYQQLWMHLRRVQQFMQAGAMRQADNRDNLFGI